MKVFCCFTLYSLVQLQLLLSLTACVQPIIETFKFIMAKIGLIRIKYEFSPKKPSEFQFSKRTSTRAILFMLRFTWLIFLLVIFVLHYCTWKEWEFTFSTISSVRSKKFQRFKKKTFSKIHLALCNIKCYSAIYRRQNFNLANIGHMEAA